MRFRGRTLRLDLNEISGSLGDLATFLPLAIGLIAINGVNATSIFLSAGLLYIAAGLYYGVPVPVQPLKATSAIAIALAATPGDIAATALLMGLIFVGISFFNLSGLLGKVFPRPIVRGIQLGLGILLVKKGLTFAFGPNHAMAAAGASHSALFAAVLGGIVLGIILLSRESRRYPAALVVIVLGILCGLLLSPGMTFSSLSIGWIRPEWGFPFQADLRTVILLLLLPQIPLTFANSVVATADAAGCYYGEEARRVNVRSLAASLGIANLFTALIGGMPMCHGSGGVTAHYRFGARTGGANLFIGGLFVILALLFGKSIASLFGLLPPPVLGILLVYVGLEHARLVRDIVAFPRELGIAVVIGFLTLVTGNLAVAFAAGIVLNAAGRMLLWKDPRPKAAWEKSP
ncbi:MAG: putative sulfate/molybdate transporter [Candidatus Deferrimicrobiaceae bacterium]